MTTSFTYPPETYRALSSRSGIVTTAIIVVAVFAALLVAAHIAPEATRVYLVAEPFGAMEMSGVILPALTAILAFSMLALPAARKDPLLPPALVLFALGCIYIAGEEISWGQWFLNWDTPEYWRTLNDQQETNFHNTSDWLDQKPRLILVIAISWMSTVGPYLLLKKPEWVPRRFDVFYPPLWMAPIGIFVLFCEHFQHVKYSGHVYDILDLLRPGEIQEVYIFAYLFLYALMLRRRIAVLGRDV